MRSPRQSRFQDGKLAVVYSLFGITALGTPACAQTQQAAGTPPEGVPPVATQLPAGTPPIPGTEPATPRRSWLVVPYLTLRETFTDNVAPFSGTKRDDQVTEIVPGILVDANTARLKWHLDYRLREIIYAQADRNSTQHHLRTFGNFEAVDRWLYVDFSGIVAQQDISPFALQTPSNVSINPNRTQMSSFRVSPFVRGEMSSFAEYELRYARTSTRPSSSRAPDMDMDEWSGRLKGRAGVRELGWSLEASKQTVDYSNGRQNESDRVRGLLSYLLTPEFRVSVSAGRESNDYMSLAKRGHTTHGYGFDWQPTPRTQLSAFKEQRFFGDAHAVNFSHRTPRTVLHFSDTRDISFLPDQFTTVNLGSIYGLMFEQLASRIPDPVERAQYVDVLLQQFGIPRDALITRGFLAARVSVVRRQEASFALIGPRNMLTLAAIRSEHQVLGTLTGATDVFSTSSEVRQRGYLINFSHRLTPSSSVQVIASQQNTAGSGGSGLSTELKSLNINFSTRLSPRATGSLGARRSLFSGSASPYSENAVIAAVSIQF